MKEVFKYYIKNCDQAMIHQNKVSFDFGNDYLVEFTFERINIENDDVDDDYFSFNGISCLKDMDELFNKVNKFTTFYIKGYEYLGNREDYSEGKSITNEMYSLIKKINSYKENSVLGYSTYLDYGDPMCNVEANYIFSIQIIEGLRWDLKFAKFIIESNINEIDIPDFYTIFFQKNSPIKDNRIVPVLSTNTKVRRLGYFKILSLFLNEKKKVPVTIVNKKFENYCLKYKSLLEENQFDKGLINGTKSGISAKPYIDAANDLGFLNKINNIYYSGKLFKVYQALQCELSKSNNIFKLNNFDKIFFLESILKNDLFYFSSLLELLYIEGKTNYSFLTQVFQSHIIKRLENFKQLSNTFGDRLVLNHLDTILNRIKKWGKAEVYLEHIIMPRLNWMLDLEIVTETKKEYKITEIGQKLFKHLCIWNDINADQIISADAFLDRFMVHLYDDCYNNSKLTNPKDEKLILEKMYKHIENSFDLFKTLAPNRVTASQAVNYTKYKLYFNDNIKVGYQYILNKLSEKGQDKFIFKYQEQYQDGYIQKRIKNGKFSRNL